SYGFSDIADKAWAVDAINALSELGIISGVGNGKFAPDASCKRADFAIMLVNVLGIDGTAADNFDDVQPGKYYYNYVGLAKEAGIVNGYGDGNFGPENFCTRAELMVMVANALKVSGSDITADESVLDKFSDADEIPAWARPYIAYLVEAGIVNGANGKINANNEITRAEVAVIMYNVVDLSVKETVEAEVVEETDEEETEVSDEESAEETTEDTTEEAVEETTEAAE
ncbi:MAG: S-layer homology domain-containing protein, partial [Firmicutes bacterium]|nr:S-layer homology domain-containing protein [Bacillota bacterium]